ncbi:MAG: A/G-specific adenine glycosylase [Candidatus Thiodiazotropha lotti]|uniref:A/G-specific adenine glycosylase n=1 Tax=Candidatus Thiodiazotropha endoloripes TaxID=1818881 RepID=UPI00083D1C0C|nr:A/G-specific adenine glycosylase [Candidatus Thiodiazotropha endoloripes]MCG7900074.1 A/G-specific adenine glycosylase [Candidatus Thiodiazotropha weberae]MCG7991793.1 A/G-specific adenine glycosylase [Candidatus Thiodiazotropha lotti]MCG7903610.1 A/G-specific adenine glycosylase [Candidatus Thiodiazotropha weberae]MCG7913074.1 A/G-specific adenine glycosylase [Candidatus Thiodiazotropha weberae]MCG8000478.1 A/G-specific adenine glycosylase [Candidatus Thiodiazotropha lotti]
MSNTPAAALPDSAESCRFAKQVLGWFAQHGRTHLPWQNPRNPYRVWVSEIMLQQTQVTTVIDYFNRFMESFPELKSLAEADSDLVMHHWSGLGYYARARNLHRCAQLVMAGHQGKLPEDLKSLQSLPGIGRSTAGAIRSLAFGHYAPILDGNVKRVLARHYAVEGWPGEAAVLKRLWQLSEHLTPQYQCADYNQAMMDLGALVCVRTKPLCGACPLAQSCVARARGEIDRYPGKKAKSSKPVRSAQLLVVLDDTDNVLLQKRPPSGIWGGLWSLPECPTEQLGEPWCQANLGLQVKQLCQLSSRRHTFSHFHLDITPVVLRLEKTLKAVMDESSLVWYNLSLPEDLGLAAPVSTILQQIDPKIPIVVNNEGEAR